MLSSAILSPLTAQLLFSVNVAAICFVFKIIFLSSHIVLALYHILNFPVAVGFGIGCVKRRLLAVVKFRFPRNLYT
jgi:hypothetical protein